MTMRRSKPNRIKHSKKKRKSKKETQMDRLMKKIARKEEKMRQEEADAEKYGKVKRGRNRAKDWYSK
jgi:hypothetical protein